jgi:hypothetical protein
MRYKHNKKFPGFIFFVIVVFIGTGILFNSCQSGEKSSTVSKKESKWEELKIPNFTPVTGGVAGEFQKKLSGAKTVLLNIEHEYSGVELEVQAGLKKQLERVYPTKYSNLSEDFTEIISTDILNCIKPVVKEAGLELIESGEPDIKINTTIIAETWATEYDEIKVNSLGRETATGRRTRMVTGFKLRVESELVLDNTATITKRSLFTKSSPENKPINLATHPSILAFSARDHACATTLATIFQGDPNRIKPVLSTPDTENTGFLALKVLGISAEPILVSILTQRKSRKSYRQHAASILKGLRWQSDKVIENVSYLIEMEDWPAIVKVGSPAVKLLLQEFQYNEARKIVWTLGEIKNKEAVQPLIQKLVEQNYLAEKNGTWKKTGKIDQDYAGEIVTALGKLKDQQAIDPLIAMMEYPRLKNQCAQSLRRITKEKLSNDIKKWKEWRSKSKK